MAFVYESLPFFGELGLGFERDFIAGKIDVARHRKPQNPREKAFFTLVTSIYIDRIPLM